MILIIFYIKWKYYKTINLTRVLEIESKKHLQYLAFRMLLGMNQGLFSFVYFVICDITAILLSFWISDIVILCARVLNKMWSFLHIVSIKTSLKHLFPQRLICISTEGVFSCTLFCTDWINHVVLMIHPCLCKLIGKMQIFIYFLSPVSRRLIVD